MTEDPETLAIYNLIEEIQKDLSPHFISIPCFAIKHFDDVPVDLFILLAGKIVLAFSKDHPDKDLLKKLISDSSRLFYIKKTDVKTFSRELLLALKVKANTHEKTFREHTESSDSIYRTLSELVTSFGLRESLAEICLKAIDRLEVQIKNASKREFGTYVSHLQNNAEYSNSYKLIQLATYYSHQTLEHLPILNKSDAKLKLIYAVYFSDIVLEARFTEYRTREQIMSQPPEIQKKILEHPLRSSLLVSQCSQIPEGVEQLILLHHGSRKLFFGEFTKEDKANVLAVSLFLAQEAAHLTLSLNLKSTDELIRHITSSSYSHLPREVVAAFAGGLKN